MPFFYYFILAKMLGTGLGISSAAAYFCGTQYRRYRYTRYEVSIQGNTSGLHKN